MTLSLLILDAMGSPKWARSNGGGLSAFRHAPFGADDLTGSTIKVPGFNGQRRDPVSHTYHLGNGYRAYNPLLMRFNCPDNLSPFGAGGINPYAYCVGDPINRADPSGHISWQAGVGIGLGILGIIATAGAAAMAISAAGGIGAALSATSGTALLTGGVGMAADAIGIASGAVSDTNPELSATLGWVSVGAGLVGMAGAAKANWGKSAINRKKIKINLHPDNTNSYQFIKGVEIQPVIKSNGKVKDVFTLGYISNLNKTGEPALFLHGSDSHHLYINGTEFNNLASVVHYLNKKHSINLFSLPEGNKLHLLSCYGGGEQGTAQRLATFLDYPVVGYGNNQIIKGVNSHHYLREDTKYPRINLLRKAKGTTYYPQRAGLSTTDLWQL